MRLKACLLLTLLFFAAPAWAQDAPQRPETSGRTPFGVESAPQQSAASGWRRMILDAQRSLQKKMTEAMRAVKAGDAVNAGDAMNAALLLIGVSFLYGVFHAAGPGHGKAVISSYMLANKTTLRRGVLISVLAALVQACSAIILVGALVLIMKSAGLEIRQMVHRFEMVSALLIAATGLFFLTVHVRRRLRSGAASKDSAVACDDIPDPGRLEKKLALRELITIVIAVGIRPCTGAIIVLLFSMRLGLLWAGVVSAFVMAIGTSITVSALAALAVGSRDLAARFAGNRWTDRFYDYATITACLLVTVIGAGLFWQSLGPMQPF